jgi:hypothetical protein
MRIVFHWGGINFKQAMKPVYEEKFTDDLQTLFKTNPKEAHISFEQDVPTILAGSINNESGKKLCNFKCELLNGNTTSYNFG